MSYFIIHKFPFCTQFSIFSNLWQTAMCLWEWKWASCMMLMMSHSMANPRYSMYCSVCVLVFTTKALMHETAQRKSQEWGKLHIWNYFRIIDNSWCIIALKNEIKCNKKLKETKTKLVAEWNQRQEYNALHLRGLFCMAKLHEQSFVTVAITQVLYR